MKSSNYVAGIPLQFIALASAYVACSWPNEHPGPIGRWPDPFAFLFLFLFLLLLQPPLVLLLLLPLLVLVPVLLLLPVLVVWLLPVVRVLLQAAARLCLFLDGLPLALLVGSLGLLEREGQRCPAAVGSEAWHGNG